jgi:hypothetical protein
LLLFLSLFKFSFASEKYIPLEGTEPSPKNSKNKRKKKKGLSRKGKKMRFGAYDDDDNERFSTSSSTSLPPPPDCSNDKTNKAKKDDGNDDNDSEEPDEGKMSRFSHLTNYSLNKKKKLQWNINNTMEAENQDEEVRSAPIPLDADHPAHPVKVRLFQPGRTDSNKGNPQDEDEYLLGDFDTDGTKWSITSLRLYIRHYLRCDDSIVFRRIHDVIIKTIMSAYHYSCGAVSPSTGEGIEYDEDGVPIDIPPTVLPSHSPSDLPYSKSSFVSASRKVLSFSSSSYELYGFDIMLDTELRPYLIEVNVSPSLQASSCLGLFFFFFFLFFIFILFFLCRLSNQVSDAHRLFEHGRGSHDQSERENTRRSYEEEENSTGKRYRLF